MSKKKYNANKYTEDILTNIDPEKRLLSIKETARILGMSERTLYNKVSPKSKNPFPIRPKRFCGYVKFDRHELEKFINDS